MSNKFRFLNINLDYFKRENELKIDKNNEFINVDVQILPRFIKSKDKKLKKVVKNSVEDFVTILLKDCKNFDLNNFRRNFRTLKFNLENQISDVDLSGNVIGAYDVLFNQISIYNILAINHELLHASSTGRRGNYIVSGFSLFHPFEPMISNYFNEGYTQLLTERYFENVYISKAYRFAVNIAKEIEIIVGKDLTEELYFRSDLLGLVNELKKYKSLNSVEEFFKALEFFSMINNHMSTEDFIKPNNISDELVDKNMTIINNFLFDCNKKSNVKEYKKGLL